MSQNDTKFVSWYKNKKVGCFRHLSCKDLLYLNVLGSTYHVGFGYNIEETFTTDNESPVVMVGDYLSAIKNWVLENGEYRIIFDLTEARRLACVSLLPHRTIKYD